MQNVGAEQFDFNTFKSAYDTDLRVKAMIKNFDKAGIEPKTQQELAGGDDPQGNETPGGGDPVAQMAKRATDLSDL